MSAYPIVYEATRQLHTCMFRHWPELRSWRACHWEMLRCTSLISGFAASSGDGGSSGSSQSPSEFSLLPRRALQKRLVTRNASKKPHTTKTAMIAGPPAPVRRGVDAGSVPLTTVGPVVSFSPVCVGEGEGSTSRKDVGAVRMNVEVDDSAISEGSVLSPACRGMCTDDPSTQRVGLHT